MLLHSHISAVYKYNAIVTNRRWMDGQNYKNKNYSLNIIHKTLRGKRVAASCVLMWDVLFKANSLKVPFCWHLLLYIYLPLPKKPGPSC